MPKKGKCPSTDECIKNVVNPDNGILHNNKKEWIIDIWNNTVEHQKHNAKWKKPDTLDYDDYIYKWFLRKAILPGMRERARMTANSSKKFFSWWKWAKTGLFLNSYSIFCHNHPNQETTRYSSTGEWINKLQYIYTVEYYSAIIRNVPTKHKKTWMYLKCIRLYKNSQSESAIYHTIPTM